MQNQLFTLIYAMLLAVSAQPRTITPPPPKTPDLIVAGAQRLTSSPTRLMVTVKNQGSTPAGDSKLEFLVRVGPNVTAKNFPIGALGPGMAVQIPVDNGINLGTADAIELRADIGNSVDEGAFEGNNLLKVK